MAIPLRKSSEIDMLRNSGLAVAKTLSYLEENVKAGMSLLEVDRMGEEYLNSLGFKNNYAKNHEKNLRINKHK